MTEADWLACEDPAAMLAHYRRQWASDRKLRLLICAYGRHAWAALNAGNHRLIQQQEREPESLAEHKSHGAGWWPLLFNGDAGLALRIALSAVRSTLTEQVAADLVRELLGNPFRPVVLAPGWMTADVLRLAADAYDNRAFEQLPILADALEDAGCTNDALLSHLRSPGPHLRGCWALDLILGKQ